MFADAAIPSNLDFKVSVKLLVSDSLNNAVFISPPVWSAVAEASIPSNLEWSAVVKFSSVCDGYETTKSTSPVPS